MPGRIRSQLLGLAAFAGLLVGIVPAHGAPTTPPAADPAVDPYTPYRSMSLPMRRMPYAGVGGFGADFDGAWRGGGQAYLGYRKELIQPAAGALGYAIEGYTSGVGDEVLVGARLFAAIRAFRLKIGIDVSSRTRGPAAIFTFDDPITRGGLLGVAASARVEVIPARSYVGLGLAVPLFQPWSGKTRPRHIAVAPRPLPGPPQHPAVEGVASRHGIGVRPGASLHTAAEPPYLLEESPGHGTGAVPDSTLDRLAGHVREAAEWIDLLTTPFITASLKNDEEWIAAVLEVLATMSHKDERHPDGRHYPAEVRTFHRDLAALFDTAGATTQALELAREVALQEIILPFNRDFGRLRSRKVFEALAAHAESAYAARVHDMGLEAGRPGGGERAFTRYVEVLGAIEEIAHKRWDDTRMMWLPFQFALLPEQHDAQAEVDSLLVRMLDRPLVPGNDMALLINEAFSPALIRSIHETRDYHVLWIHDFAGTNADGEPDEISHTVVVRGYLNALTRAVREFDRTGRIPSYFILLDEWYFDARKGRWWMGLLQDPIGNRLELPDEAQWFESQVVAAQESLRAAVRGSARLQEEARRRGDDWLHGYVKVHVNVTFPPDPTFAGRSPVPTLLLKLSDDYMRDHSKIAFCDLSEDHPALGEAFYTGEGVGENYEAGTWEDRTLQVRGPAALELKARACALLRSQGFRDDEIPPPLRVRPLGPHYAARAESLQAAGWNAGLLQAFNATGYGPKQASAMKAALYNLMPAGSRILVPDSQWTSFFWAGMLAGAALRGCRVYVIAPRPENAPYGNAWVQTVLTHDLLEGYMQMQQLLAEPFAASGGELRVGLYGQEVGTRNVAERYLATIRGFNQPTFPRELFPFPDAVYTALSDTALLMRLLAPTQHAPRRATPAASRYPRLHLKSQFYASDEGLRRVLADPGWFRSFVNYIQSRAADVVQDSLYTAAGVMTPRLLAPLDSCFHRAPAEARERDIFYVTMGSHNQCDRSLLLDGEVLCAIPGYPALTTLIDFFAIAARTTWVTSRDELDRIMPRHGRTKVRIARMVRGLF